MVNSVYLKDVQKKFQDSLVSGDLREALNNIDKIFKIFKGFEFLQKTVQTIVMNEQLFKERAEMSEGLIEETKKLVAQKSQLEEEIKFLEGSFARFDQIRADIVEAQGKLTSVENLIVERLAVANSLEEKITVLQTKFRKLSELATEV